MLHPVHIVAAERRRWIIGRALIVFDRVCAAAFGARSGRNDGGLCGFDQVVDFERFDTRRVEHTRLILERDARHALTHVGDFDDAFVERDLLAEDGGVLLHHGANVARDVLGVLAFGRAFKLVQALDRAVSGIGRQWLVLFQLVVEFDDVIAGSATEYQQVEQRVGA